MRGARLRRCGSDLLLAAMVALVAFIVFVERSERRIPVQSARRIVGRRQMGGVSSHLPLKVNSGGVMPVIFAASILSAPLLFRSDRVCAVEQVSFECDAESAAGRALVRCCTLRDHLLRLLLHLDRLPSGRYCRQHAQERLVYSRHSPRRRTSDYINDILTRITLVGAVYLILISLVPTFLISGFHLEPSVAGRAASLRSADLGYERYGVELLLRWNFAADRGGRGDGYGQPGGVAADHAAL
jgi:preprotein translocase subunit SecY